MKCQEIIVFKCARNHSTSRKCYDKAAAVCRKCDAEDRERERKRRRDHELDEERQANQIAYARKLAQIEDEIDRQKRILKEKSDQVDRQNSLSQKQQDLENLKAKVQSYSGSAVDGSSAVGGQRQKQSNSQTPLSSSSSSAIKNSSIPKICPNVTQSNDSSTKEPDSNKEKGESDMSESKSEWEYQKEFEGAENEALDSLMTMIGEIVCSYNIYAMLMSSYRS